MTCPYLSKWSKDQPDLYDLDPETPMTDIITDLFSELKVKHKKKEIKHIVDKLEQNLITRLSHLARITPSDIKGLQLPIVVQRHLIVISRKYNTSGSMDKGLCGRDMSMSISSVSSMTSHTPDISEKEKKLILDAYDWLMDTSSMKDTEYESRLTKFTTSLYTTMFSLDPNTRGPFQNRKVSILAVSFGKMLGRFVKVINDPIAFHATAKELGVTHRIYGVKKSYFATMRVSYSLSLKNCLGDKWSKALEIAWLKLYDWAANVMISAMDKSEIYSGKIFYCTTKKTKQRWCELSNNYMRIYHDKESHTPKMEILFTNIDTISDRVDDSIKVVPNRECSMTLHLDEGEPIVVAFKNAGKKLEWKTELRTRIMANKRIGAQLVAQKCPPRYKLISKFFSAFGL
mmetsp:Transcript_6291/g.6841  ORF Transcript_6291/g.6841 Transcript_6291/m.6841 type:complete len:401 (+) Transcript_6291:48-1250(+)